MLRLAGTGVVSALLALALPAAASAQSGEVLDASCPGPPGAYNFNDPQTNTENRFAQVFTAGVTGSLVRAEAAIRKSGTAGSFRVEVAELSHSGVPSNIVLASTLVADAAVPAGDSTLAVGFAPAAAVTAGQRYALVVTRPGSSDLGVGVRTNDICPGALFESPGQAEPYFLIEPDLDLVFSVFVIPDDAGPPETTITKQPKSKTRKKTATFEFSGNDARAVAGFECSLDGAAFAACSSPFTVKVKKGKHTFSVRARDAAGNVDGAPATADWKVKRKRRR
jgi:hypothetical protein